MKMTFNISLQARYQQTSMMHLTADKTGADKEKIWITALDSVAMHRLPEFYKKHWYKSACIHVNRTPRKLFQNGFTLTAKEGNSK